MDNVTAHSTTNQSNPTGSSYVDAYVPPATTDPVVSATPPQSIWSQPAPVTPEETYTPPAQSAPFSAPVYTPPSTPATSLNSVPAPTAPTPVQTTPSSPVVTPAVPAPQSAPVANPVATQSTSEELEDQNIFFMLGVTDGSPEQRESFLDELQQVIWEDFLEFDVKLLITREEQTVLNTMLAEESSKDLEKQEKIVVYLEKLVPDLEEIMLEKALELKEEMARERVKGMREFYAGKTDVLAQLDKADELMNVGKWHTTATLLNSIH